MLKDRIYSCTYGFSNRPKQLTISDETLIVSKDGAKIVEIPLNEIKKVNFSANYIQFVGNKKIVVRGIRPKYNLASHYSLSDKQTIDDIVKFFESKRIKTQFKPFILDPNVLVFLLIVIMILLIISIVLIRK